MRLVFIISCLFLSACATEQKPGHCTHAFLAGISDSSYIACRNAELDQQEKERNDCEADPSCDVEGKQRRYKIKYPVITELLSKEYQIRFDEVVCGRHGDKRKWPKNLVQSCEKKFSETFVAKLAEVYQMAAWQEIQLWCTANPIECSSFEKIEDRARESHQSALRIASAKHADAERLKEKERTKKIIGAISEGLRGMGQGLQNAGNSNSVSCTTNTYGYTSYTNCH